MTVSTRIRACAVLATLVAVAACDDKQKAQVPTAPISVAPDAVSAYVAASNTNPGVGSNVTLFVRARRGSQVGPIGSFTIRLSYDSTRLRFVESPRSTIGMVMANPTTRGLVIAAGAAAEGFTDDNLFSATFAVTGANALQSVALHVTELNTVTFKDQRANTRVERALYRDAGSPR